MARGPKLYTLTELAKETGLSLPTLQRYKKKYQSRISSVGEGRTQRYPKRAIAQVEKLKKENQAKRGRPRKRAAGKKRRKAATAKRAVKRSARKRKTAAGRRPRKTRRAPARAKGGLLTLSEIGRRTGISYPTLVRYVKLHLDQIPHHGQGRKRRYPAAAVAVFKRLRAASRRGRPRAGTGRTAAPGAGGGAALARRIRKLEQAHREIGKSLRRIDGLLRKPLRVSIKRG